MDSQKETLEDAEVRVKIEGLQYSDSMLDPLIPIIYKMVVEFFEQSNKKQ